MDKSMKHEAMLNVLQEIADMAHEAMGHKMSGLKARPYAGEESEAEEEAEAQLVADGKVSPKQHAAKEAEEHGSEEEYESEEGEDSDAAKLLKMKAKLGK
jgi:hypothetical protein